MTITPEQRAYLDRKFQTVGIGEDVAKSVAFSGVPRAAAAIPMWLGDITNLAAQGVSRAGLAGYEAVTGEEVEPEKRRRIQNIQPFFSSSDVVEGLEDMTGQELYRPQTGPGKIADTATQFALGSKASGGKLLTGVGAGVGSELAGMATEGTDYEIGGRILGALAGGGTANYARNNAARLTPKGAQEFSSNRATKLIGKTLKDDGVTPSRLDAALRKGEIDLDLAEATGSRGLQSIRKTVGQSPTKAGRDISRFVESRNNKAVPASVKRVVKPLAESGAKGRERLQAVLERNTGKQVGVDDVIEQVQKRSALTNPKNVEGRTYAAILDELEFAKAQGGTFDALHRAKQGLDNIYIEGADDALMARASRVTGQARKAINDKLAAIDVDYGQANRQIQAGIAADDVVKLLNSTNEGAVGTLYNKLSKSDFKQELSRLMSPKDYKEYQKMLRDLRKIKRGGMAGSDTRSNQAAAAELEGQTGLPSLESATDLARGGGIGGKVRDISSKARKRDYEAIAQQLRNPNREAIVDAMNQPSAVRRAAKGITPQAAMRATVGVTQPAERDQRQEIIITPEQRQYLDKIMSKQSTEQPQASVFDNAFQHVLEVEGGFVADDAGAGPSNMGVNKRANPDLDIKGLTQEDARRVYKERYWDKIGADKMPPALAMVAFDGAVNQGVGKTKELLKKAGGDPMKLLQLREQHYANLIRLNPKKFAKYGQGWKNRLIKLQKQIMEG